MCETSVFNNNGFAFIFDCCDEVQHVLILIVQKKESVFALHAACLIGYAWC